MSMKGFSHSPGSRLSIDPDHHVTEAIGDMYGDYSTDSSSRYSFIHQAPIDKSPGGKYSKRYSTLSVPGIRGATGGPGVGGGQRPPSPTLSLRSASPSPSDAANKPFPLNDIGYESDPVAVAQEISNLQALRRMSMDVTSAADPDLPSFNNFVPSTPPDDGGDPGSVFWVPARLHPELAPQEFSAYLELKKHEIRRPQPRDGSLTPDSANSKGQTLRRKKSMLSRQVDDANAGKHYRDGADRLEKRKSLQGGENLEVQIDDFLKDPTILIHKLSINSKQRNNSGDQAEDEPILFAPKVGLKRSTATHYRRGSLRRERVGSKRSTTKATEADSEVNISTVLRSGCRFDLDLTTPSSDVSRTTLGRTNPQDSTPSAVPVTTTSKSEQHVSAPTKEQRSPSPKYIEPTRLNEPPPVPVIVETPPPIAGHPERHSSFEPPTLKKRPTLTRSDSLNDLSSKANQINSLEIKIDKKDKKRLDASATSNRDRKTSWGWLLGDSDKDKEKEGKKEREREEKLKAKREKRPKSAETLEKYDNTRLDVLQKSIEMGNTGKVVAADPAAPVLDIQKSDSRKSRSEEKKERDSGFLSFFGSSRKKSSDQSGDKKGRSSSRGTSPDPHHEKQQPYYYSRFPIHIERAIYRLSHLKLANPRRPLHQQVLLSNFMYSYLAKVQQTQPHLIQQATTHPQQQNQTQADNQRHEQQWKQQQHPDQGSNYYQNDDIRDQSNDHEEDSHDDLGRPHSRQGQYDAGIRENRIKGQDPLGLDHTPVNGNGTVTVAAEGLRDDTR